MAPWALPRALCLCLPWATHPGFYCFFPSQTHSNIPPESAASGALGEHCIFNGISTHSHKAPQQVSQQRFSPRGLPAPGWLAGFPTQGRSPDQSPEAVLCLAGAPGERFWVPALRWYSEGALPSSFPRPSYPEIFIGPRGLGRRQQCQPPGVRRRAEQPLPRG